ncbi:MAG: endonuclease [Polaribacter sp.]|uniref:endonuclease n=1 Tax=Polaribacter sp. TaxID=1920175 RepID=UPI00326419C5
MMMKRLCTFWAILCFTTISFAQQNYYNDVNLNLTGIDLKDALATKIINTHTRFLTYDQVWYASKATDVNPLNSNQVLLIYGWEDGTDSDVTNNRERGINANSGSVGDWNREHVFSRSLGDPNLGEVGPGSDAHHLRPADVQRNSSRGNRKFSNSSGNSGATTESYIDALDGSNSLGWYPGDEWKGDVARMIMYMYVRYGDRCLPTNVGLGDNSNTPDDMIDLFLQWNVEDPVSNFEKLRNTYHENTTNTEAQGNRNPFIDNPRLATRIWGGSDAEDIWGIYTSNDTEVPTIPTNLSASNITTFSVDISWSASTDNVAVTSYDVYIDGKLKINTTNTSTTISGLDSNTSYSISVLAKDIANNKSLQSSAINVTTLQDTEAPTVPNNVVISNETGETFKITWNPSTDNTAVVGYDIFIDTNFINSVTEPTYTATNLSVSTTYTIQVLAKDAVGNKSSLSTSVNATTTDGSTTTANELFFSEYVEGSSNNKAIEIVNVTPNNINLNGYSIKRQQNAGKDSHDWDNVLQLSGTINSGDVFVIINGGSSLQNLIDQADLVQPNASQTNWGAPINFNGNDPVGLFKNDVLIDIIGVYNEGGTDFAKDKTIRRKSGVSQPNTAFDIDNEWDIYSKDNVDDIGQHNSTLSINNFISKGISFYPNPVNSILYIENTDNFSIKNLSIYNYLGKKIRSIQTPKEEINTQNLSKGIYILKFEVENKIYSTKFIKN